jgi:MSHA biogenesis protein MshN
MSVINKVLQELDQRNRLSAPGDLPPQQVRAVAASPARHEWFWRLTGVLIAIAVGWVAWVAYQLQPRTVATPLALEAAARAHAKQQEPATVASTVAPIAAQGEPVAPLSSTSSPSVEPAGDAPAGDRRHGEPASTTARQRPVVPVETMKLALSIDTPILPAKGPDVIAGPDATARTAGSQPGVPQGRNLPPLPERAAARLERKDRAPAPADRAEREFRRGVSLLRDGRAREAEAPLAAALAFDPAHEGARQALIALQLDGRRLGEARKLLEEGLALNPRHLGFSTVLARVYVERGEYERARQTLMPFQGAAKGNAEYGLLLGNVEQRLGRHAEAAEAFRGALDADGANGPAWVGLGVSLQALDRNAEAAEAFRRSLAAGLQSAELRTFAEQRVRALR